MNKKNDSVDTRFKLLNREADLIVGLISSGMADLRRSYINKAYYYQGFYGVSIGLERILKLLIFLNGSSINIKSFNHDMKKLFLHVGIFFKKNSIEQDIIDFLNDFALKRRYQIVDVLNSGDYKQINNEPIAIFYEKIIKNILNFHPPKSLLVPKDGVLLSDLGSLFMFNEDFSEETDMNNYWIKNQLDIYALKYVSMYIGRILQPIIEKINGKGYPFKNNPDFSDHFKYLKQNDSYFKNRKTFNS